MNVVLTGMRGTGKSSIGRILAQLLGYTFVDTDAVIETRAAQPIAAIVTQHGWAYFRALERQVVAHLAPVDKQVIATGGGTLMAEENVARLKANGIVVLLVCELAILCRRIARGEQRPSLTGRASAAAELAEVWEARRAQYYAVADMTYDVSAESHDFTTDIWQKAHAIHALLQRIPGFCAGKERL